MIVYNVGQRFFIKKYEAEQYAKHETPGGLQIGTVIKVQVSGRDELAELLNGICDPNNTDLPDATCPAPKFLRECWAKRSI